MVIYLKLASGGIPAATGRSSRAGSNQAVTNNTEVNVEVKREPGMTSSRELTMGRRNKVEMMSTTMEYCSRKLNKSVCYTRVMLLAYKQ